MISLERAKRLGFEACISKLGYDNFLKHKDTAVMAYGENFGTGTILCYVGVGDAPEVIRSGLDLFPFPRPNGRYYYSSCYVSLRNGAVIYFENNL